MGVLSSFEEMGSVGESLFLIFLGLVFIGISPLLSFVGVFCEEVEEKLFTYITGNSDF